MWRLSPTRSMNLRSTWRVALGGVAAYLGWRAVRSLTLDTDLDGKVVLITGGSRGLGLVLARQLARAGCKLALCARNEGELVRARDELEALGCDDVLVHRCDVSQVGEVEHFVALAAERFGGIDVVVNNAGVIQVGPVDDMTLADFEQALAVNFWGGVYTTFAALPYLRERRGRIVNITSIGGKVAVPHLLPYDCAKFAFLGFSEGMRAELSGGGVSVTTIVPGLMRTGSALNAEFRGQPAREFGWFALGAALPLSAMNAERAGRRIVKALRRREAEVTLTVQAKVLRLLHDLFPGLATDVMALVNRLLPSRGGEGRLRQGRDVASEWHRALLGPAARRNNELREGDAS